MLRDWWVSVCNFKWNQKLYLALMSCYAEAAVCLCSQLFPHTAWVPVWGPWICWCSQTGRSCLHLMLPRWQSPPEISGTGCPWVHPRLGYSCRSLGAEEIISVTISGNLFPRAIFPPLIQIKLLQTSVQYLQTVQAFITAAKLQLTHYAIMFKYA